MFGLCDLAGGRGVETGREGVVCLLQYLKHLKRTRSLYRALWTRQGPRLKAGIYGRASELMGARLDISTSLMIVFPDF